MPNVAVAHRARGSRCRALCSHSAPLSLPGPRTARRLPPPPLRAPPLRGSSPSGKALSVALSPSTLTPLSPPPLRALRSPLRRTNAHKHAPNTRRARLIARIGPRTLLATPPPVPFASPPLRSPLRRTNAHKHAPNTRRARLIARIGPRTLRATPPPVAFALTSQDFSSVASESAGELVPASLSQRRGATSPSPRRHAWH